MRKLIYTALFLLLFASCDRDDGAYTELGSSELQITSSIATRASGTLWSAGDDIGVSMYLTATTTAYGTENRPYTTATTSGNFTSTTPLYFPAAGNVDLLAYYPYVDNVDFDLTAYELSVGGEQSEAEIDLMKATKSEVQSISTAVDIIFYHKLSKLQITITDSETISASELYGGTMILSGAVTEGDYNLQTDEITLDTATDDIVATISSEGVAEMILIPQTLSDAMLTFETSKGIIYTVNLSAVFASGDQTCYTAKMSLVGANLSGATISPWGEDSDKLDDDMIAGVDSGVAYDATTNSCNIYTAAGFASINDLILEYGGDINITLTNDIDLSSVCGEDLGNWTPISGFTGSFDGAGHSISGLYIDNESSYEQGLFGSLWGSGATISNVTIVEPILKGYVCAGALAGFIDGGFENGITIENCAVEGGEISGIGATGGLIGSCNMVVNLINCYNTATIKSENSAGGLIGDCMMMMNCSITDCYNSGDVIGSNSVGGLIGYMDVMGDGYFTACYNTGNISGTSDSVGGLFGGGIVDNSYITACYNIGDVEGSTSVGGLLGYVDLRYSSMTACYNSGSVTAIASGTETPYIGGVAGAFYGSEYTFSTCYFIDNVTNGVGYEWGDNVIAANDYTTSFADIAALNAAVPTLNEAITIFGSTIAYEYQAGADDNTLPTVVAKSATE